MKRLSVIAEYKKLLAVGLFIFLLLGTQSALAVNQTDKAAIKVITDKSEGFMDVAAQILGIKAVKTSYNQYKIWVPNEKKQLYLRLAAELSYLQLVDDKDKSQLKQLEDSAKSSVVSKHILVTTSGARGSRLIELINLIYETKIVKEVGTENKYLLGTKSDQKVKNYSALLMLSPYLAGAENRLQTAGTE